MDEGLSVDLNIFEGMEGFEEFNPMDDSSLAAILDDLEEGTLLSLLGDENLLSDMCTDVRSDLKTCDGLGGVSKNCDIISDLFLDSLSVPTREQPICAPAVSLRPDIDHSLDETSVCTTPTLDSSRSVALDSRRWPSSPHSSDSNKHSSTKHILDCPTSAVTKRPLQITPQVESFKRVKLENPSTDDVSSDSRHLLLCVQHDHCYVPCFVEGSNCTGDSMCKGQRASVGSSSDEEGSLSDAGYDTMSSSTSPGNNNSTLSTEPSVPVPLPTIPTSASTANQKTPSINPLVAKVDPVALIDARIKHFMCSREVNLTEEEKETLKAEGLPLPTTLPLTKAEEKALRGVRRKIRNKVAAQESRKRKKEHLGTLEDRCKQYSSENYHLKRRVETLEVENKTLLSEVKKLRELLCSQTPSSNTSKTTRVGACLMVLVLCFAIFFGSMTPQNLWSRSNEYTTPSVRSRSLLSLEGPSNFQSKACNWFKQIFMMEKFSDDDFTVDHYKPVNLKSRSEGPFMNFEPQHLYGPLSYYQHIYSQFSGYLNYSNSSCTNLTSYM